MVDNQNNTKKVYFFRGTRSVLGDNSETILNKCLSFFDIQEVNWE